MTAEQLAVILGNHGKWIRGEVDGKRANLCGASLDGANLTRANLTRANLDGANLDGANLTRANLTRANLTRANLYGANLDGANLYGANLDGANLDWANLDGANLYWANLDGANLYGANLDGANLDWANLDGATLKEAKVQPETNLTGEPWSEYLAKVVPALLTAGGKTLEQIVGAGAWECHSWDNCPMAEAFGIHSASHAPLLLRPRIEQFVQLFDAKLIPCPGRAKEAPR